MGTTKSFQSAGLLLCTATYHGNNIPVDADTCYARILCVWSLLGTRGRISCSARYRYQCVSFTGMAGFEESKPHLKRIKSGILYHTNTIPLGVATHGGDGGYAHDLKIM